MKRKSIALILSAAMVFGMFTAGSIEGLTEEAVIIEQTDGRALEETVELLDSDESSVEVIETVTPVEMNGSEMGETEPETSETGTSGTETSKSGTPETGMQESETAEFEIMETGIEETIITTDIIEEPLTEVEISDVLDNGEITVEEVTVLDTREDLQQASLPWEGQTVIELSLEIPVNNQIDVNESQWYSFAPAERGDYIFSALGEVNVVWENWDGASGYLEYGDVEGRQMLTLQADRTYYFCVKEASGSGTYQALIEKPKSIKSAEVIPGKEKFVAGVESVYGHWTKMRLIYENGWSDEITVYGSWGSDQMGNTISCTLEKDGKQLPIDSYTYYEPGLYELVFKCGLKELCRRQIRIVNRDEIVNGTLEIGSNTILNGEIAAEMSYYKFIPDKSGNYSIKGHEMLRIDYWEEGQVYADSMGPYYIDEVANVVLQADVPYYFTFSGSSGGQLLNIDISYYGSECSDGHTYTMVIDQAATCGAAGSQHRECTVCGYKDSATILPATGAHNMINKVDQNATCGAAGSQHRECTVCGYKESSTKIPATGVHVFGAYVERKAPTAIEEGTRVRSCNVCGTQETESIAKLSAIIELSANNVVLKTGQSTKMFKVTGMADGDYVKSIVSNKKSIVKVSGVKAGGSCKLKAQNKTGSAKLTITLASGLTKDVNVKVQKNAVKTTSIKNLQRKLTINQKMKVKLMPILNPITSEDKVSYSSSNKKVATVNSKGVIKGIKAGKAKITVKAGEKKFICTVKVKK